jgi:Holliday junction resolvase RusA-like endonuclease
LGFSGGEERVLSRVTFEVAGNPVPKARARVVTKGKRRFAFTPKKVKDWETIVKTEAKKHFERPFALPVVVSLTFYMRRPKTRRLDFWVSTTPDLDNLEKSVLDGLNEVAYTDDKLVVVKSSSKRYVTNGVPRVRITIAPIQNQKSLFDYAENPSN